VIRRNGLRRHSVPPILSGAPHRASLILAHRESHYSLLIERSAAAPAAKSHGVTKGKTAIGDNKPKTTPDEVTGYG
jgi:hypothetical protein